MVFSSILFIVFFLPLVVAVYYILPHARTSTCRNFWLLTASIVFYAAGGIQFIWVLAANIIINYIGGLFVSEKFNFLIRKISLITCICTNIGILIYFKYAGFFAEIINSVGIPVSITKIVLPAGISFFTFQGMSYVIDVYRGNANCQKNPMNVALYISFFPQLVAGPIVRYTTVANEILTRRETVSDFSAGLTRFCFGLGKKMILANSMGEIADSIFSYNAHELTAAVSWIGAIAYTLQIYFDFSAYSDMAIGLGRMFGFHFPENFNYPYIAKSITDFWRRWHISLSSWFRDYVYIPLGGSYCSVGRHILNLSVVWLLTGMWHGAAWNYIFWGLWYLAFLLGEKYIWKNFAENAPAFILHLYTMLIVIAGWVFFRSPSLDYAKDYLMSMIGMGSGIDPGAAIYYLLEYWPEWTLALLACLPWKIKFPRITALVLLVISYMKLVTDSFNPFIYFQF